MSDEQTAEQDPRTDFWEAEAPEEPPPDEAAPEAPQEPAQGQRVAKVGREEPPRPQPALPEPATGAAPPWALIPQGLAAPRGRAVFFARFPASWTDTPREGVPWGELTEAERADFARLGVPAPELGRQCIFWALSLGDQAIALGRSNGDPNRFNSELCKQMIRSIDGELVNREGVGTAGNLDLWWNRIGERCRSELTKMCTRIHSLTTGERALFFGHCVASRTVG
jgi:hypothetical protein